MKPPSHSSDDAADPVADALVDVAMASPTLARFQPDCQLGVARALVRAVTLMPSIVAAWVAEPLGHTLDGDTRRARILRPLADMSDDDSVLGLLIGTVFPQAKHSQSIARMLMQYARWGSGGCPTIHMTANQAAALALTSAPKEILAELRLPWRAVRIEIADSPFTSVDGVLNGIVVSENKFSLSLPNRSGHQWSMCAVHQQGELHHSDFTPAEIFDRFGFQETQETSGVVVAMEDGDEAALALCSQAVVSLCVALDERAPAQEFRLEKLTKPTMTPRRQWRLRGNAPIGAARHVQEALASGSSRMYRVRWLVRGHWREQAHGQGRVQRRRTWIAPHWKGPTTAPEHDRTYEWKGTSA